MEVHCPMYKADLGEVCIHDWLSVRLARSQHRKVVPDMRQQIILVLTSSLLTKTLWWNVNWPNKFILEQHSHMANVFCANSSVGFTVQLKYVQWGAGYRWTREKNAHTGCFEGRTRWALKVTSNPNYYMILCRLYWTRQYYVTCYPATLKVSAQPMHVKDGGLDGPWPKPRKEIQQ